MTFFAADVFLRLNGWKIVGEPDPAHDFLIGMLDRGACDFEHLLSWLRVSIKPLW